MSNGVQDRYTKNIVDAGVFRGVGKPPNDKYNSLKNAVEAADSSLLLPRPIYQELGGNPSADTFPSGSDFVDDAIENGWVEIAEPIEDDLPISSAVEDAHTVVANQSNHPKTIRAEEDAAVIGLAMQLFERNESIYVITHTTDRPVAMAANIVLPEYGYYDIEANFAPPQEVDNKFTSAECFRY
jgi:hypothetical protein